MTATHCPICLKKKPHEDLLIHLSQHGYDNIQANILLNYDKTHKGLIDNFNLLLPEVDQLDERFILYEKFIQESYRFFKPLPSEYEKLDVKKDIIELIGIYREILGCKIFKIKTRLESPQPTTDFDKYEIIVLHRIYEELLDYQNELEHSFESLQMPYPKALVKGNDFLVSWDHIEFLEGKIAVKIHEIQRELTFKIPSSQNLLNYLKDNYFKVRFKDKQFTIAFISDKKLNLDQSTVLSMEDLLNTNSKDIVEMLINVEIKNKLRNRKSVKSIIIDKSDDKEFLKSKHEYIQLAVKYCIGDDKVYSIKENYNGREEGAIIIEYKRPHHTYLLVENENLNRSAHLYTFDKTSTENIEKVCGFYLSDKENKRGIIKERGIDFKKEFNTTFHVKTLYHSDFKRYRDHLLEYLYRIG